MTTAQAAAAYGSIAASLTRSLNGRDATRKVDDYQQIGNGITARQILRRRRMRRTRRNGNHSGAICLILAELSGTIVSAKLMHNCRKRFVPIRMAWQIGMYRRCPVSCHRKGSSFCRTLRPDAGTTSRRGTKIASATFERRLLIRSFQSTLEQISFRSVDSQLRARPEIMLRRRIRHQPGCG